jgi:hypothetical protein
VEGTNECVIVNDVNILEPFVGMKNMTYLVDAPARADADCLVENRRPLDWAGAVPCRAQKNLVSGTVETASEGVEQVLRAAVGYWWNRKPGWG